MKRNLTELKLIGSINRYYTCNPSGWLLEVRRFKKDDDTSYLREQGATGGMEVIVKICPLEDKEILDSVREGGHTCLPVNSGWRLSLLQNAIHYLPDIRFRPFDKLMVASWIVAGHLQHFCCTINEAGIIQVVLAWKYDGRT